jgi:hypothetical protein
MICVNMRSNHRSTPEPGYFLRPGDKKKKKRRKIFLLSQSIQSITGAPSRHASLLPALSS